VSWDKTERKNESFSSNYFHWSEEAEGYRCPAGNLLRSEWRTFKNERSHVTKANSIIFRSRQTDCATCPMKARRCDLDFTGDLHHPSPQAPNESTQATLYGLRTLGLVAKSLPTSFT
jgi:hypothetical protein